MSRVFRFALASMVLVGVSAPVSPIGQDGERAGQSENAEAVFRAPPEGALVISFREYRALRDAGNWLPASANREQRTEARAERQDARDLATITAYARQNGLKLSDLVPQDPADDPLAVPTEDGNFLHRVTLHGRTEAEVVTFGRRWFLRTVANNIRTFSRKDNQLTLYQSLYDGMPDRFKTELALPPSGGRGEASHPEAPRAEPESGEPRSGGRHHRRARVGHAATPAAGISHGL